MKHSGKYRFTNILLIAICLAMVLTSAIGTVFHFPGMNLLSEKRAPEDLPDISRITLQGISARTASLPVHLQTFFNDAVKSYNDTFGLRGVFIFLNNAIKVFVFNVSPSNTVVIGKSDWLYFAGDRNLDYYQNSKKFTLEELALWNYSLEAKKRWLAKRGIYYLLVIAPNKETIYPEYLPDSIRKNGDISLQDQLLNSISPEMRGHILDLRGVLRAAKNESQVYYRTDSHWNQEGAYRTYCEIVKRLNGRFPGMQPRARSGFTVSDQIQRGGDLAEMFSLSNMITEKSPVFVTTNLSQPRSAGIPYPVNEAWHPSAFETDDDSLPRAVIIHDSFGNYLKLFLTPHFKRTLYLLRSGIRFSTHFETHEIEQEMPDIVIEEFAERKLFRFMPNVPVELMSD